MLTLPSAPKQPRLNSLFTPVSSLLLQEPESCETAPVPAEDESEELLLAGHHDLPAELQDQGTAPRQAERDDDFYIKIEFEKVRFVRGWAGWS